ncbi:MAG TPA: GNAT family N-acetyltransferase [Streptosporangiaceae bacterium]|jgi:hypothetical protein
MTSSAGAGVWPAARVTGAQVQVLDRAASVPAALDGLTGPGDAYLSTKWLRVAEATADVSMRYLLHQRGGQLGGALATALATPQSPWLLGRTDSVLEFAARDDLPGAAQCLAELTGGRAVPRTVEEVTSALTDPQPDAPATGALLPSLLCGGRHVSFSRALTRADGEARQAVIGDLAERAEGVAAGLGARSAAFLYVEEQDARLRAALAERGYLSCVSGLHAQLCLPDGGFAGYQAMLPRKRRQSMASERRKVAAAGIEIRREPLTTDLIASLAELESALFAKHGGRWTTGQSVAVMTAIMAELGPEAFTFVARLDGAVCGFTLVVTHKGDWFVHRGGFDYQRVGDLPLYFELTYNLVIESAAAAGARAVHHGMGALDTKRARGFEVRTAYLYVKPLAGR